MARSKKSISAIIPQMCDIYLQRLNTFKSGEVVPFLNEVLAKKKVYVDYELLQGVITFLLQRDYIQQAEMRGTAIISYSRKSDFLQTLAESEGTIDKYEITDKGRHFVESGQKFHIDASVSLGRRIVKTLFTGVGLLITLIVAPLVVSFLYDLLKSLPIFTTLTNAVTHLLN